MGVCVNALALFNSILETNMKNEENFEKVLPRIIVKWEALSKTQKQEILERVENVTASSQSTEDLKLQSSFYLQTKSKL